MLIVYFVNYQYKLEGHGTMSMEVFKDIVQQAENMGVKHLSFTPIVGEPLIDKDLIKRLELLKNFSFNTVSMTTNAILLGGKNELYKHLCNGPLTNLHISTTEFNEETYAKVYRSKHYKKMITGVSRLLKYHRQTKSNLKILFSVRPVKDSFDKIFSSNDYIKYIRPYLDSKKFQLNVLGSYDNRAGVIKKEGVLAEANFRPDFDKKGQNIRPCSKAFNGIFTYNGTYRACTCGNDFKSDLGDALVIGNIKDKPFKELYREKKLIDLRESFVKGSPPEICRRCTIYK